MSTKRNNVCVTQHGILVFNTHSININYPKFKFIVSQFKFIEPVITYCPKT